MAISGILTTLLAFYDCSTDTSKWNGFNTEFYKKYEVIW